MKIAVVGLGYVGLPLSLQFARSCVSVLGIDVDPKKVELLNKGQSYIKHIEGSAIAELLGSGKFSASTDFGLIKEVEAVIICVPTPLNKNREPDLSFVLNTGRDDRAAPSEGRSCCAGVHDVSRHHGGRSPCRVGRGIRDEGGCRFSPRFLAGARGPGEQRQQRKVNSKGRRRVHRSLPGPGRGALWQAIETVVPVSSCRVAEATKLLENIFRSVNIALVNELKLIYSAMGIDIWEVIEAARTKPFGFMPFYPGPGLGGHCIPIDPFYLTWKAREVGQHTRFIELAGEINTRMPEHVVHRVADALNSQQQSIRGSQILIVGLAYKPNVDDERESPSYVLMELLS